jgi:peptide/nickel transport system substrate-binding protein
MIPKHYYEQVGQEVFATKPIGTGPYKLVSWDRDDKIVMEAFDKHWRGVAAFKNLIHRAIPEDSTRLAEAMTGGVHVATGIPPVDAERLNASGVASAVLAPLARMLLFWCEMRDDAPTADLRVRQAIDYAIDNMALVRDVVQGAGTPVRGFVDDMIFGSARELNNAYRFDPDKARELLKDAGYGPGNELNIKVQAPRGRYPMDANVAEIVAVMLNEVGIKTSLEILEWSAYSERVANADRGIQSIAMLGLGVGNLDGGWAVGSNYTRRMKPKGYVNPELEDLLAKIDSNMNLAEREKQIQEAMRIIDKDLPFIFMYRIDTYWAVNNKVDWTPKIDEALWMFTAKPK